MDIATEQPANGVLEIRDITTGHVWSGDIEAQGPDHLRVCLRPGELGAMPIWAEGTAVDCALEGEDGRYYASGSVNKQTGAIIWLTVPALWDHHDRRHASRIPGAFAVNYKVGSVEGVAACIDIAPGGLRLRVDKAIPLLSQIYLNYQLPGDDASLHMAGYVVYCINTENDGGGFNLGVRFAHLTPTEGLRISTYCHAGN